MITQDQKEFEGVLVAGGWDGQNRVADNSLYTEEGEELFLEYEDELEKLKPYLNKWVKIKGKIVDENLKKRKIYVESISCPNFDYL